MWRIQDEEQDYQDYAALCRSGEVKGTILEWRDVEAQIAAEAKTPFTAYIDHLAVTLSQRGKSRYPLYAFGRQETNDCCAWGTSNGVDLTVLARAWRGEETTAFRTFKPWVYGVGKCLAGQNRDNGMSVSLAMKHITACGVLPDDLPGLPRYSGAVQKELLRTGKAFYEKWKEQAVPYEVDVVRMPLDYEAWYLAAASGRNIVYGTQQRLSKKGGTGDWVPDGSTNHCRTCGFPVRPSDGAISDTNSWNDGTGFMSPAAAKKVIAKSHSYGAYLIWRIARRDSKPDYSGLGGC
jgi:hypothetical protein